MFCQAHWLGEKIEKFFSFVNRQHSLQPQVQSAPRQEEIKSLSGLCDDDEIKRKWKMRVKSIRLEPSRAKTTFSSSLFFRTRSLETDIFSAEVGRKGDKSFSDVLN